MMNEQTGAHKDAAENYEQAWKYSRKNQPSIGNMGLKRDIEFTLRRVVIATIEHALVLSLRS